VIPTRPSDATGVLLALWSLGFVLAAARLVVQYRRVRALRHACTPLEDRRSAELLQELAGRLGLLRVPKLVTGAVGAPLLTGVLHPLLVLPPHLAESAAESELRLVVAHELAHLKRRDLVWGWLVAVVDAVCFFHPLLWL